MKVRVYMRVAKGASRKPRVHAATKPSHEPIYDHRNQPLPTAKFAIDLELPDEAFAEAERLVAELKVDAEAVAPVGIDVKEAKS